MSVVTWIERETVLFERICLTFETSIKPIVIQQKRFLRLTKQIEWNHNFHLLTIQKSCQLNTCCGRCLENILCN